MSARTDALWAAVKEAAAKREAAWTAYASANRACRAAEETYYAAKDLELHGAPLERVTRDAARKKLAPTVASLQESAFALLDAMIRVTE